MSDMQGVLDKDWHKDIRYPLVYRVTTGQKIACGFLGLLFGAMGIGLFYLAQNGRSDGASGAFLGFVAMCLLAIPVYALAYAMNARVTLEARAIEVRGAFGTRRLETGDIVGRRLVSGRSVVYPVIVPKQGRPLRLTRATFGLDDRFNAWFSALPDLDEQERASTLAMVEQDATLGSNAQERLSKLEKAKQTAKVLNLLPMALLAWGFVYPRPYAAMIACAALMPWLAIGLSWAKPNLFQLDGKQRDVRPNLATLLIMPPLVLAMRALFDVHVIDIKQLLLWGSLLGMPLCLAVVMAPKAASSTTPKPWALPLVMLPFMAAYGVGLLALVDTMWDDAPVQVFQTSITGKHVSHGRSTTYEVYLAPWGDTIDDDSVMVSRAYFDAVNQGDMVCVRLHPGRFGLRWMQLGSCRQ
ncbi:PH domain-containing protein [Dyella amyloliquefaciens]|uniref:PH domain-containing protein n=1 Tax=Dyella amyloliquefaciens TaxID=1770545 RepID=UPI00102E6E64|nr:PH domain-containing protein [Dyella amyloliquefaciens]